MKVRITKQRSASFFEISLETTERIFCGNERCSPPKTAREILCEVGASSKTWRCNSFRSAEEACLFVNKIAPLVKELENREEQAWNFEIGPSRRHPGQQMLHVNSGNIHKSR